MKNHSVCILPVLLTVLLVCGLAAVVLARFYAPRLRSAPSLQETEILPEKEQAAGADEPEQSQRKGPVTEGKHEPEKKEPEESFPEEKQVPETEDRQPLQSQAGSTVPSGETPAPDPVSPGNTAQSVSEQKSQTGNNESGTETVQPFASPEPEQPTQTESTAPANGGIWENELEIDP